VRYEKGRKTMIWLIFWTISGILALSVMIWVVAAFWRTAEVEADAKSYEVNVYKAQLAEVDRDLTRGIVTEDQAETVRLEISRRLLAADASERAQSGTKALDAPETVTKAATFLGGAAVVAGALGLYATIGAPGYGDMPHAERLRIAGQLRAERPSQEVAQSQASQTVIKPSVDQLPKGYLELVETLRATIAERPDDARGQSLLANAEARLGNYTAAYTAQLNVTRAQLDKATAEDWALVGEFMVLAAGGYVSPEAEDAFAQAMQKDPTQPQSRFYIGRMFAQTGRPDRAFQLWRQLLDASSPVDPWVVPIRAEIEDLADRAGIRYQLPPYAAGPSAEAITAARDMSAEDRTKMIGGMVSTLNTRLATEGGTPADWARLINAYSVLDEMDAATAIWQNAQESFADAPEALAIIKRAADASGISQ
jgi:cytochrome c-type biogenesis protein CcmH